MTSVTNAVTIVANDLAAKKSYMPDDAAAACKYGCTIFSAQRQCPSNEWWWNCGCCPNNAGKKAGCNASTCTSQPVCMKIDSDACPGVGDAGVQSQISASYDDAKRDERRCALMPMATTRIQCTYPLSIFTNANRVKAWQDATLRNDAGAYEALNSRVMSYFCAEPESDTRTCPTDPKTGRPMTSCSRMHSKSPEGDMCAAWASDAKTSDAARRSFCHKYPRSPDCLCIARDQLKDPAYELMMEKFVGVRSACWWKPCTGGEADSTYLHTQDDNQAGCPEVVCLQYFDAVAGRDVDTANITYTQTCGTPSNSRKAAAMLKNYALPIALAGGGIIALVAIGIAALSDKKVQGVPK